MEPRDLFFAGMVVVAIFVLIFAGAILPDLLPTGTPAQAHAMLLLQTGCGIAAGAMIIIVMARKMKPGS